MFVLGVILILLGLGSFLNYNFDTASLFIIIGVVLCCCAANNGCGSRKACCSCLRYKECTKKKKFKLD